MTKSSLALLALAAAALAVPSAAFAPSAAGPALRPATGLSMARNGDDVDGAKKFAASSLAAAFLLASSVASPDAAFAFSPDDGPQSALPSFADSSSVVLAGRSGGRAGGRAMPRSRPAASSTTKVYNTRTTVIAPGMGGGYGYGGYGYGGYGYDPTPGLVFGAVNAIGNGIRESRQNQMIYEERAEISASREREAEMAARIRQLEAMQMQQQGGKAAVAGQPQTIIVQPPAPAAAVAAPAAAQ